MRVYLMWCDVEGCSNGPGDIHTYGDERPTPAEYARRQARQKGFRVTSLGSTFGVHRGWRVLCPEHRDAELTP